MEADCTKSENRPISDASPGVTSLHLIRYMSHERVKEEIPAEGRAECETDAHPPIQTLPNSLGFALGTRITAHVHSSF